MINMLKRYGWIGVFLVLLVFLAGAAGNQVLAAPLLQPTPFPTPTPGPDGRIIYVVQEGDTLFRISAISGVSLDEIRALNNLGANDVITVGQRLLLGLAGPPGPTQGPEQVLPSPTPNITPTPGISTGTLCILLFDDINGDALRQDAEMGIAGGAISLSSSDGQVSETATTRSELDADGLPVPECFNDLPVGDYNITIAAPEGYNPTTLMNYALSINGGDETYLDFGAQANSVSLAETPVAEGPTGGNNGLILGIVGGLLVLGGIGLGIYAFRINK
jgi:hypothetical protein